MAEFTNKHEKLVSQIPAMWKKIDETSEKADAAMTIAQHADHGFIEMYATVKQIEKGNERILNYLQKIIYIIVAFAGLIFSYITLFEK